MKFRSKRSTRLCAPRWPGVRHHLRGTFSAPRTEAHLTNSFLNYGLLICNLASHWYVMFFISVANSIAIFYSELNQSMRLIL